MLSATKNEEIWRSNRNSWKIIEDIKLDRWGFYKITQRDLRSDEFISPVLSIERKSRKMWIDDKRNYLGNWINVWGKRSIDFET